MSTRLEADQLATLDQALTVLERTNPRVAQARQSLDETIERISEAIKIQPEIDAAKRQAILDLIYEKYRSCDQKGLDSMIITAQFRGYELTEDELFAQLRRCTSEVQTWWLEPCDLSQCQQHVHV